MTKKKRVHRDFEEFILEQLQDPQEAAAYLKMALADEDEGVFLLALRNVALARCKTFNALAEETHLNKQNLYRMLSKNGNPRLTSLKIVLEASGFEMDFHPIKK
jgi:probable addiction module antidote protein